MIAFKVEAMVGVMVSVMAGVMIGVGIMEKEWYFELNLEELVVTELAKLFEELGLLVQLELFLVLEFKTEF